MKTILFTLLAAAALSVQAAETNRPANVVPTGGKIVQVQPNDTLLVPTEPAKPPTYFNAGEFNLDAFGVLSRPDLTGAPRWGEGFGASYFITRGLGFGIQGISYNDGGTAIDEGNARILFRAPLWDRIAPYGFVAGLHNFSNDDWGAGAGGGLEYRFHQNVGVFGETGIKVSTEGDNNWSTLFGIRVAF